MHFEYISEAVSQGLMRVQLDSGVPLIFGYVDSFSMPTRFLSLVGVLDEALSPI